MAPQPHYRAQALVEIEMEIHLGPTNKSTIPQYIHTYILWNVFWVLVSKYSKLGQSSLLSISPGPTQKKTHEPKNLGLFFQQLSKSSLPPPNNVPNPRWYLFSLSLSVSFCRSSSSSSFFSSFLSFLCIELSWICLHMVLVMV